MISTFVVINSNYSSLTSENDERLEIESKRHIDRDIPVNKCAALLFVNGQRKYIFKKRIVH